MLADKKPAQNLPFEKEEKKSAYTWFPLDLFSSIFFSEAKRKKRELEEPDEISRWRKQPKSSKLGTKED